VDFYGPYGVCDSKFGIGTEEILCLSDQFLLNLGTK